MINDIQIVTILPKEMRSCLGSLSGKKSSVEHFNFHFFPCVCWSLCLWMFQLFHLRFQTNNCIIFFICGGWKKWKIQLYILSENFENQKSENFKHWLRFHYNILSPSRRYLINDGLQCMMQVVYLHELGKIIWGKIHACYSLPRLKKLYPFTCDFLISLWLQ